MFVLQVIKILIFVDFVDKIRKMIWDNVIYMILYYGFVFNYKLKISIVYFFLLGNDGIVVVVTFIVNLL